MSVTLHTDRFVLRRFQRSDAARLAERLNDFAITRWIGTMPYPYTLAMAESYLAKVCTASEDEDTFALIHRDDLAGAITIRSMLGFWLAPDLWGRGLMTEAARCMIARHFSTGAAAVRSGYLTGNQASQRVHEKLGFARNGTTRVRPLSLDREVTRQDLILTRAAWEAQT